MNYVPDTRALLILAPALILLVLYGLEKWCDYMVRYSWRDRLYRVRRLGYYSAVPATVVLAALYAGSVWLPVEAAPSPKKLPVTEAKLFEDGSKVEYRTVCLSGVKYYVSRVSPQSWAVGGPVYGTAPREVVQCSS
jgi:hypothetical protein